MNTATSADFPQVAALKTPSMRHPKSNTIRLQKLQCIRYAGSVVRRESVKELKHWGSACGCFVELQLQSSTKPI